MTQAHPTTGLDQQFWLIRTWNPLIPSLSCLNHLPRRSVKLAISWFALIWSSGRDLGTSNENLADDGVLEHAKKAEQVALKATQKKTEEAAKGLGKKQKCIQLEGSTMF